MASLGVELMTLIQFNRRAMKRGFSMAEVMVTVAIISILAALLVPAVVNTKRMTKRRLDYIQYRDYLRWVAFSFEETKHLEQPLLVSLDFTGTDVTYEDVRYKMGEMFSSTMMNGFPHPEMRYLEMLDFTATKYDDTWTEWIIPAPALLKLHLDNTVITDATLKQMHPLTRLKTLTLVQCNNLTDEGIRQLRAALPKTEIITTQRNLDKYQDGLLFEIKESKRDDGSMNNSLNEMYEQGNPDK
jgi:prepilin-type N-terminal cleavage/methylation domain-containing protein